MGKTTKELKTTLDWANEYVELAWPVFPVFRAVDGNCSCPPRHPSRRQVDGTYGSCGSPGKHPLTGDGHKSADTDIAKIEEWFTKGEYNVAIRTGTNRQGILVVIDIDQGNGKPGAKTLKTLEDKYGELPDTLIARTGSGGRHYVYWAPDGSKIKSRKNILRVEAGLPDRDGNGAKTQSGIDVRAEGGYIVAAPSNHVKGKYSWVNWGADIAELPAWLLKALADPVRPASPVTAPAPALPGTDQTELPPDDRNEKLTAKQVIELLSHISPDDYDDWMMFGHVLKTILDWVGGEEAAFQIWDQWCRKWKLYQERAAAHQRYKWQTAFNVPSQYPIGLLKKHAKASGWKPSEEFQKQARAHWKETAQRIMDALPDDAESDSDAVTALFRALSHLPELVRDDFLAKIRKRFKWRVAALRSEINRSQKRQASEADDEPSDIGLLVAQRVLVGEYDKLLIRPSDKFFWKYNGKHWEPIENGDEIVGDKCIDVIELLGQIPFAVSTVKNQAIDLLHSRCAREGDPLRLKSQLPPVINCLNGELWIQPDGNIKVQDHSPDSFLRFCLNINYDPEAECPLFDQAVLEIFAKSPNPEEMRRHLYEMFGYAIQPKRDMKQFWMWEGGGDNGKTGLADTLQKMIGDAATFSIKFSKVDSDYNLSAIKQCLLVRDNDIDWRTVLPDGIVKQLSEDASLTGRDPYGKPTGFKNCSLPLLLCNKYPMTKDLSHAVQVRAHVIPFRRIFIKNKDMKRGLFEQIWKTELPGILRRSIEGLKRLRERGEYLEPEDCLFAKQEFLRQANPLPRFIAEACVSNNTPFEKIRQQARLVVLRLHFDNPEQLLPFESHGEGMESVDSQIAVAMAKAESERLGQPLTDLYKHFWQWTRNEGIQMAHKPTRADVENYLINLGYPITIVDHQKWVDGVRAFPQVDQRPVEGM